MFNDWWVISVVSMGAVAAFATEGDAQDYANMIRDSLSEARGLTSIVSVKQNKE